MLPPPGPQAHTAAEHRGEDPSRVSSVCPRQPCSVKLAGLLLGFPQEAPPPHSSPVDQDSEFEGWGLHSAPWLPHAFFSHCSPSSFWGSFRSSGTGDIEGLGDRDGCHFRNDRGPRQEPEEGGRAYFYSTLGPPNSSVKGTKLGVPSGGASFPGLHKAKPRSLVGGL